MAEHDSILKNNKNTDHPRFGFTPKTGVYHSQKGAKVLLAKFTQRISQRGSCQKRRKPQAPTPQAPIRNRKTRKVANAKVYNRCSNVT